MEEDNILNLMASYDFKTPINVTVLIDEDETIHGSKTDEVKTVIKSEDVEVLTDNIARYKSNTDHEVKKEDMEKQTRQHNEKHNRENLNKRKFPIDCVNTEEKIYKKINCSNKELKDTLENSKDDISKKDTAVKNMIPDKFNELNPSIKDMLKTISQHLILITEAYLQFKNYTNKDSKSKNTFSQIKSYFYSLSYSTVLTVLLPQENNHKFIKDFLESTIKLAEETKSICIPLNHVEMLLFEMLKWVKIRKESLQIMSFSNVTSNYNNYHESSLTNHSSSLTTNLVPSQSFMPDIRQSQGTNLAPSETTRHFESTDYSKPSVENFRAKNIAPAQKYNYSSKPYGNIIPTPVNNPFSTRQSENACLISPRNVNSRPSENTRSFCQTNTVPKLPTATLPSSNPNALLSRNTNKNLLFTPNVTITPSRNLTLMAPRNMVPLIQNNHSALRNILTSPDPSTLTSQTNILSVLSRRVNAIVPNTCIFAAGPPGKEVTIHVPSNSILNGTNNNVYKNCNPPNNVNPCTRGNHLPHFPQNNSGYNYSSWGHCGQSIFDASRTNYESTINPNFQTNILQSNILTVPCQSRHDISLATSQNNFDEQQLQHNLNKQMEAQMESRRPISTDSGFISPLHFVPAEQAITTSSVQDNDVPCNMPLITNVTSLNPNVSDEKICRVCSKKTDNVCLGCHKYYYCSEDCQRTDWTYHKNICIRN